MKRHFLFLICSLITLFPAIGQNTQRILIDIGADANKGGVVTVSPSLNGNTWNNMTNALPGIRVSNAVTTNNIQTTLGLEVINRIDGTFNTGELGIGSGNNPVIVGDYPGSATTDHALVHSSATNGRWRIFGLDPANTYTLKFWGARTNTTASRSIEIKRADDNTWLSYNATNNTNFNNAVSFTITGKSEMNFDIRTKAGSDFSCINVLDISFTGAGYTPPPNNNQPVAHAGNDITLNSPASAVTLDGCQSTDIETAPLIYRWTQVSGPQNSSITSPAQCNTTVNNLITGVYVFELLVKDTGNLNSRDSVKVTVNNLNSTPWPPQVAPLCGQPYKIVIVGSSSAYGTGANPIDSSWANKFRMYVQQQNPQSIVTNIATPGLTSYEVLPTGFTPPANRPVPDVNRNITKALSLNPNAVIINLPSNDIAMGYSLQECEDNFNRIAAACEERNIPVWISTTQPRDRLSPNEKHQQVILRDWIIQRFGNKSVDFWTTVGNEDGSMNPAYSAGDSVHLNNYGHHILFTRIVAEKIWDTICLRRNQGNQPPIARAGTDQAIQLPANKVFLDGRTSTDADGNIISYQWSIVNGAAAILTPAKDTTSVSFSNPGTYTIRLVVTDNSGASSSDDVVITVIEAGTTGGAKTLRVNIYGGVNPYINPAWNNWNVIAGVASNSFNYEDGSASSVTAILNTNGGISDNGTGYAPSAVVCPPAVLRYNSYNTSIRTLTMKGLDPAKKYYMEFYASRANTGNGTVVSIGTVSDTINTDSNVSDYAKIGNISPQANGDVMVNLSRIGTYNYIAGFIIKEQSGTGRSSSITSVQENKDLDLLQASDKELNIYPNPFSDILHIRTGKDMPALYDIQITNIYGNRVFTRASQTAGGLNLINTSALSPGIYFVTIRSKGFTSTKKIIKE